jgi:hypothetical protein
MQSIKFVSNKSWLNEDSPSKPGPVLKTIPDWYRNADRFAMRPDGEHWVGPDGGKIPTWKACPAIYDIMGSGYVYKTPCDIEFYVGENGQLSVKIDDPKYSHFVMPRAEMPQFPVPYGYNPVHFAWWSDWAVELPEGYSAIYTQPLNRFELPFLTTAGIVDNDKVNLPGTMPFFLQAGWTGVIPAGTAYAQIMPFKRESWTSEYQYITESEVIREKNMKNAEKYRIPDGGVYQRDVWERRKYE